MQALTRSKYNKRANKAKCANSLDKLAQLVTLYSKLDKRARKKALSNAIVYPLMTYANEGKSKLKYYRTHPCARTLEQNGNKITTTLCRQRWCVVCSSIRTAKFINQYQDAINAMQNPMFLTFTRKAVTADKLAETISEMIINFKKVVRNLKKTHGIKFVGIRKTESQYTYIGNGQFTFNPHFHIIADLTEEQAQTMMKLWLKLHDEITTNPNAQDIRQANPEELNELFKYEVKPITTNKKGQYSPAALNTIYESLYKRRCIQAYGIKAKKIEEEEEEEITSPEERTEVWKFEKLNYYNETGEALTNYIPDEKDLKLFKITNYKCEIPPPKESDPSYYYSQWLQSAQEQNESRNNISNYTTNRKTPDEHEHD